jgi:hypothetical protein
VGGESLAARFCLSEANMRAQTEEMSLQSAFAWIAVTVAASAGILTLAWGFDATQTVVLSAPSLPLAA